MKTKIFALSLIAVSILLCVSYGTKRSNTDMAETDETKNAALPEINTDSVAAKVLESEERLNDVRFGNWTDKDWYDNDYFRFLRQSIDDCLNGTENEDTEQLQEYKPFLQGQFFVNHVEAVSMGGLYIYLAFVEKPEILYEAFVYSYVKGQTITGYNLRSFVKSDETLNATKEQVIEKFKEYPHLKLW